MDVISKDQTLNFLNDLFGEMETVSFNDVLLSFERLSSAFEGMTNGDVLQAVFPKAKIFENENNVQYPYVDVFLYSENHMNCYGKDWWNAPYQKGGEV